MKRLFALAGVLALVSQIALASDAPLFHLSAKDVPVENGKVLDIEFHELERRPDGSTVQVTRRSGGSVSSSMFVMRGMCGLARARGARYVVPSRTAAGDEGGRYTVAFPEVPPERGKGFTMAQCELFRY